ncbi:hypothetical protein [Tropicimonas sp. IMCC34043]|uniref:hypothetical protein n=1 Tax=Tropicimonas sp. IMCC34043 TaxID=2248760 RepID=UPI000E284EB8|nr:hypothetical protein [Tropicimonas sp. IMCC34043]
MLGRLLSEEYTDPRYVLAVYLGDLVRFLGLIAYNDEENWKPPFSEALLDPMRAALERLPVHASEVETKILELTDDQIQRHGLAGPELTFKFAVIDEAYLAGRGGWSFFGWRRLIDALDVLLNSILSATGAGTAISEIKDYIGLSIRKP